MPVHRLPRGVPNIYTPYKNLLYTNVVPSDQECLGIREFVVAPKQEAEELSNTITLLQVVLDHLTRKREELTEFVDSHLALVSSARKLPHDILMEIFTASLPEHRYPGLNRNDSPLQISRICSDWRTLALSMPQLWSSFHIAAPSQNPWTRDQTNTGVESWLTRTRDLPLSISFAWDPSRLLDTDGPLLILQTLMGCCRRWRHVRFITPNFESLASLWALSPDDVPLLETVVLQARIDTRIQLGTSSFIQGPSIRGMSIKSSVDTIHGFAWDQLHRLCIPVQRLSTNQALDILHQCPRLQTCTFRISVPPGNIAPLPPPICWERMRELCVIDDNATGHTDFFQRAVFPNLCSLEYAFEGANPFEVLSRLDAPNKLTSLGLSTSTSFDGLGACLALFPILTKLLIHQDRRSLANHGDNLSCPLFSLLIPSSQGPTLCPHLQEIYALGVDGGSDAQLSALIESRSMDAVGLQALSRLHIVFARARQSDITFQLIPEVILRYPTKSDIAFMAGRPGYTVVDKQSP
ncbi:hypothetical protein DFH07DRAFT_894493, partial [Mycena maculata]